MAYIDLSVKQIKALVKLELDESQTYEFPDFMISETTNVIKQWEHSLDYNKLKKLQKALDKLIESFDGCQ